MRAFITVGLVLWLVICALVLLWRAWEWVTGRLMRAEAEYVRATRPFIYAKARGMLLEGFSVGRVARELHLDRTAVWAIRDQLHEQASQP